MKKSHSLIKFIYLVLCLGFINIIASCDVPLGETFTITYYSFDEVLDLSPSSYQSGTSILLPIPKKDNYEFVGWYQDKEFMTNIVNRIKSTDAKNFVFYAKWNEKTVDPTPTPTTYPISVALESADDSNVTVEGYISAFVGNNFYLTDNTSDIYIYCGSIVVTDLSKGDKVRIVGTKATSYGVQEIKIASIDNITSLSLTQEISSTTITSLDQIDSMQSKLVSATNLNVSSLPTSMGLTSDFSFTVSCGTASIDVFVSRHINETKRSSWINFLSTLSVGDAITLQDVVVTSHNKTQLALCEDSMLTTTTPDGKPTLTKIEGSKTSFSVEQGTTLTDALQNLTFTAFYSDTSRVSISLADCSVSSQYDGMMSGAYEVTITYQNKSCVLVITVNGNGSQPPSRTSSTTTKLEDVLENGGIYDGTRYDLTKGIPSTGDVKVLVIPVGFKDVSEKANMKQCLEKAFFGTSDETGWESLSSYYQKASFGKLNISGTVLSTYQTGNTTTYYENKASRDKTYAFEDVLAGALGYYDSQIDYSEYDSNNDGYIDAIYLVYTADINYHDKDLWWAVTGEYYSEDCELFDHVEADFYTYLSYNFIYEKPASGKSLIYNAETIIHESGHLLGLDDYYDYDTSTGPVGGVGGGVMMDYNIGDQDAYSKSILGWIQPYLVTQSTSITLSAYETNGDAIILAKKWANSYFTEYYIIDYYTPTGLNEMEAGYSGLFSTSGIRIFHIDATINSANSGNIWDITKYNNGNTSHKLISLVEADGGTNTTESTNKDIYTTVGKVISNLRWYDGTSINCNITISSIKTDSATLKFDFVK